MFECHLVLFTTSCQRCCRCPLHCSFCFWVVSATAVWHQDIMFAAFVGVTVRVTGMSVGLRQLHCGSGMGGWREAGVESPTTTAAWIPVAGGVALLQWEEARHMCWCHCCPFPSPGQWHGDWSFSHLHHCHCTWQGLLICMAANQGQRRWAFHSPSSASPMHFNSPTFRYRDV